MVTDNMTIFEGFVEFDRGTRRWFNRSICAKSILIPKCELINDEVCPQMMTTDAAAYRKLRHSLLLFILLRMDYQYTLDEVAQGPELLPNTEQATFAFAGRLASLGTEVETGWRCNALPCNPGPSFPFGGIVPVVSVRTARWHDVCQKLYRTKDCCSKTSTIPFLLRAGSFAPELDRARLLPPPRGLPCFIDSLRPSARQIPPLR